MNGLKIPPWLEKHSSNTYLLAVFQCLASREKERELARSLSEQASFDSLHDTHPASRSKARQLISKFLQPHDSVTSHGRYSVAIGLHPANQLRNRYFDIQPYDRTRVVVNADQGVLTNGKEAGEQGKYLNASWVLEKYGQKWWIASQAPLPNTAHTFLSLLLQPTTAPPSTLIKAESNSSFPLSSRVRTIVQLTRNVEGGRRKADAYFPGKIGQSIVILPEDEDGTPALQVTLLGRQMIEEAHCIRSSISLVPVIPKPKICMGAETSDSEDVNENVDEYSVVDGREPVTFQHMFYTSWPDHGVPRAEDRASLLAFLKLVDTTNRDTSLVSSPHDPQPDPDPPIIVGCSAGIGRTGSFIALSSLLRHYGFLPPPCNPCPSSAIPPSPLGSLPQALQEDLVVQEVDSLREQRPGMVQRNEQIRLIYEILVSAFVL
ncbi:putative protein tyrosine phosphatase, catalytic domain [Lyophyllum shimeji]|uniref:Uncharacterized protein n=1 Tax=Lyophyllum shimeji TaxID=47721 RepID=A0A9P3PY55_LYOSH|nr:putative protein tyrosine phosphatase, catalytic domain [Lyophyllum shimeji]